MSQPPPEGFNPPDDSPEHGARPGPSDPGQPSASDAPSTGSPSTGQYSAPTPPGAYPPPSGQPTQSGPPPGYQGQPGPGQGGYPPPPPGYQQGPPPGYQQGPPPGYQQGPPPGYQQGPPPGYQQGPPQGAPGQPAPGQYGPPPGYGPPAGPPPGYAPPAGYGPPQQAAGYGPPPGAPGGYGPPQGAYPAPAGGAPKAAFDISKISIAGWGVLGASLLTLIASFFSFWHVTSTGLVAVSVGLNGWSLWWWLPVLIAVAVGVIYALQLFGVLTTSQVRPEWLTYGAAASFILIFLVMIQTFFYGGGYSDAFGEIGISYGPSFGVFFALVTTAALTYFSALAAQGAGAKLPFKVPGPS